MSRRNGDRSRFQVDRKRRVKKRERMRALLTALLRKAEPAKTESAKTS